MSEWQETPPGLRAMFGELVDFSDAQIEVLRAFCLGCNRSRVGNKHAREMVEEAFGIRLKPDTVMCLYSPAFNESSWFRSLAG